MPAPEAPRQRGRDWNQIARSGIGYGWRALVFTVVLALIAGVIYPASRTTIPEDPLLQSFDCASPPCFPQTPASRLGDLLVKLPPVGYSLALLFCLPGLIVGGRHLLSGRMQPARELVTPFLATLLVLVGADFLPRLLNPCLTAGSSLPMFCGEFVGRWDVQERWNTMHHALLGGLPLLLVVGLVSGRFRERNRS